MPDATATTPYADLAAYVERLFAHEDALLRELREEIRHRGMPEIYISPDEGRLLQVLLTAVGARRVLEIGTLGGYSTIWLARALPADGRVVSLEIEPARAEVAREFARRAGLEEVIDVRVGAALDSLARMEAEGVEPFDACFIDADKANYSAYLDHALRLVRPGGLILGDNALWAGRVLEPEPADEDTRAVHAFNQRLAAAPELVATIVVIRDGLAIAAVRRD